MKTFFRFLLRILFRFRAYDMDALKTPGPVLLIPNHCSWLDWLFLWVCLDDDWKFVTSSVTAQTSWLHRKLMINRYTLSIDTNSPYVVKRMAEFLKGGGRLVLFAEGRLSRTGTLMKLFDGTGFLIFKTKAKVITAYLRGAERLPYSPNPGWKKCFPKVTAHFSAALVAPELGDISTGRARSLLTNWLRNQVVRQQFEVETKFGAQNVFSAVAQSARMRPGQLILEDATQQKLTYRKLMVGADVLADALSGRVAGGERVGVLLPNVNATPVVILALWRLGKVPAVLNFSSGIATMLTCANLAGLKHIVTSLAFLERAKLKADDFVKAGISLIYLEDVRAEITSSRKFFTLLRHILHFPSSILHPPSAVSAAVIVFTSGSEGVPKGVELTHGNILANIRQMLAVTDLTDCDRLFNCLPLFHSFGLTVGTFLPLVRGLYVFLYPSPLHYRMVTSVLYGRDCTVFLSTNTFLNGYARKGHPYDFRSLRYLFAAAEKLQEATALAWAQKYGVRILEGYGATECSPCVSVNTPLEPRYGSVGRLLPGMDYELEPVEGVEGGGRLFVRGPNVMKGYLNADANAKFQALGGWYDTGDIVSVDAEGYLHIRGRLKRFAKVSGEMVSLSAVEDALAGAFPQYGLRCQVAVITRPDENKGEALIAVTNEPKLTMDEIRAAIKAKGLTNLSVPREIKVVKEIPKLGTGKVNHRELQALMADSK
ncbi:MAG: AMP-binding protein [Verrucomicrobia bacterium]|jgi:acyl-[acyl-carrier-protein]-phospholipid O-acyltransferase/long-chain-fatty-acid--[acyl-carrier-protein] ligase|nr:AMP-binding protein [Verrucomicrobiota bacterium]